MEKKLAFDRIVQNSYVNSNRHIEKAQQYRPLGPPVVGSLYFFLVLLQTLNFPIAESHGVDLSLQAHFQKCLDALL